MLSNFDIDVLVKKMEIKNFKGCFYKDKLKNIESNSSYILNLNSELDEDGNINKAVIGLPFVLMIINKEFILIVMV